MGGGGRGERERGGAVGGKVGEGGRQGVRGPGWLGMYKQKKARVD